MQDPLILGRYRRLEYKGAGGSGMVEICWDTRIQRRVAIKRMPLSDRDRGNKMPEGLKEARTGAMLSYPSIVSVIDFDVEGDYAYLIMEAIDGPALTNVIDETPAGDLDLDIIASVAKSIGEALDFAHENQVLHLDIKPDNVLITRSGITKVSDFGIAELADAQGFGEASGGTLGYMPPEQMRGELLDQRCDEFAFASLIYEMLTGKNPFTAPTITASIKLIEQGNFPAISDIRDDVDPELDQIMLSALSPQREERFETIYDFIEALLPQLGDPAAGKAKLRAAVTVDDEEEEAEEATEGLDVWGSIPTKTRFVAGRALTALLCWIPAALGLSVFEALSLPMALIVALIPAAAGAFKPVFGSVLSLVILSIGMIASSAVFPVVGVALLLLTGVWAIFLAHEGVNNDEHDANVNCTMLAIPFTMVGVVPLTSLVTGFCMPVKRALVASAVSTITALLLCIGTNSGNLAHSGLMLAGNGEPSLLQNMLTSPGTWVMMIGCILSTTLMSAICSRATRVSSIVGACAATAVLVTTQVLAQWLVSQVWGLPSLQWVVADIAALALMIVAGALGAPYRDKGEE